jgi:ornithine decarboxylase
MHEMDRLQYRLEFPTHREGPTVRAVIAGPTCDSDDAYGAGHPVPVPAGLRSGDPVWVPSAYAVSYMIIAFNGFDPLPHRTVSGRLPVRGGR